MNIPWDEPAGLMRVTAFATADATEELVARGTLRALVGQVLAMPAAAQRGLLIRSSGADRSDEYDTDAIRELAARPGFTGAHGAFDTADRPDDADIEPDDDDTLIGGGVSGPDDSDALGQDGEK